jgi:hypothetical protein
MARIFSHIRVIRFIREIRVKIFALARTLFTHERINLDLRHRARRVLKPAIRNLQPETFYQ